MNGAGPSDSALGALLVSAASVYRRHPSAIGRQLARNLRQAAGLPCSGLPVTVSACRALEAVFHPDAEGEDQQPLLSEVARVLDALSWRTPGAGRIPDPVGRRTAAVEIVGPNGMIDFTQCRFGLYLQMPHTGYPEHFHDAEELYLVLSGTAQWSRGTSTPTTRSPGSFIHHRTRLIHATHTDHEPLLAMWGWTGNIDFDTYTMVDETLRP